MTLIWGENGIARALVRRKGQKPLHLSLRTTAKREAQRRYDAVRLAYRSAPAAFIDQMRDGTMPVERVTAIAEAGEPFTPIAAAVTARAWLGTVDQECDRYLEELPNRKRREATVRVAGFNLQEFRNFEYEGQRVGDMPFASVTSKIVQAFQKSLRDAERPVNSISLVMARVSSLWNWVEAQEKRDARDERRDARAVYVPIDSERITRETTRRDRMLTAAEIERLWAATPEPLQWIVGCGVLGGLRIAEALHLRPGIDVDLELGTITIRDQADWKPKTTRSKRLVPMAPALLAVARRHAAAYASASWMMPSPVYSDRPFSELGFRAHFKTCVERAGLTYGRATADGVTFHTLRHSFASHAVMSGVDLYTVAKLLGDSLKIVEDVYADLSPDFKRRAVEKLADAFAFAEKLTQKAQSELQEPTFEGK